MPKKKGDRKALTPTEREHIWQTYNVFGKNKSETARRCNCSTQSVAKVVREIEAQNELSVESREARAEAAVGIQRRTQLKADTILESITKQDVTSGRIPIRDKDNNITGYREFGPSLLQKATAYGILTDKSKVALDYENALRQDEQSGKLLVPQDIEGLKRAIQGTARSIQMLNIQFKDDIPDLATKVENLALEEEARKEPLEIEAEVISLDDFDG